MRITAVVRARWRPVSWLSAEGNFNYDQLSEEYIEAEPVTYWSASSKTGGFPGNYERSAANNRNFNTGVSLTGNWQYHGSGLMEDLGLTVRTAASYGTAGLRPSFFAQYEVLQASGGTFIKNQLGNRLLRPAHSGEFEVGFNAEFWHGRFHLEYN